MSSDWSHGGEGIIYPVTYDIKIIMDSIGDDSENERLLRGIMDRASVAHQNWRKKMSSGNKYVSFSATITLVSQEQMNLLYSALSQEPNIRFAI